MLTVLIFDDFQREEFVVETEKTEYEIRDEISKIKDKFIESKRKRWNNEEIVNELVKRGAVKNIEGGYEVYNVGAE